MLRRLFLLGNGTLSTCRTRLRKRVRLSSVSGGTSGREMSRPTVITSTGYDTAFSKRIGLTTARLGLKYISPEETGETILSCQMC